MSKQPQLSVASPLESIPAPPIKFGNAGLNLWNRIQREYGISDAGGVELLCQICSAADTVELLSEQIAVDGTVIQTRTGPRAHPAIRDQLNHRSFITRTMSKLGLNVEPVKTMGRPSTPTGWQPSQED